MKPSLLNNAMRRKTLFPYTLLWILLIVISCGKNEKKSYLMGEASRNIDLEKLPLVHSEGFPGELAKVDLSPYAPVVATQNYPNCYAYASAYTARTLLYNVTNHILGSPHDSEFSTAFVERMIDPNPDHCRNDAKDVAQACYVMAYNGVVKRAELPEDCTLKPISHQDSVNAMLYLVNAYRIFMGTTNPDTIIKVIKQQLTEKHPVIIDWVNVASFNPGADGKKLWVPTTDEWASVSGYSSPTHAICVIGYDNVKYTGAFLVQSSWGTIWGDSGRIWIRYRDLAHFSIVGMAISNPTRNYRQLMESKTLFSPDHYLLQKLQ
jgi:hypothetical protein